MVGFKFGEFIFTKTALTYIHLKKSKKKSKHKNKK
jgi:ribosomal protein S19